MAVYVDSTRNRFGRMVMCHMWADAREDLLELADKIGLARKWIQEPPKARWVHFDVSLTLRAKAVAAGAIETDRYGALEHVAKMNGDSAVLARIEASRARSRQEPVQGSLDFC